MKGHIGHLLVRGAVLAVLCGLVHPASAHTPPGWADDPNAISYRYTFPDANLNPEPATASNIHGAASAQITVHPLTSSGWQDPDATNPPETAGAPGHGAWSLGAGGTIEIVVPIGAVPKPSAMYDIQLSVVGYTTLSRLPSLRINGLDIEDYVDAYAFDDPRGGEFQGDEWWYRTWSPQLTGLNTDSITFTITGSPTDSVIDTVELFAIPEPSAFVLISLVLVAAYVIRHLRCRGCPPRACV